MSATSIREIEAELAARRREAAADDVPELRTSVATHIAWVPQAWDEAAHEVLEGLGPRHPSRVIVVHPEPGSHKGGFEAEPALQCFPIAGSKREVCAEIIHLRLRGATIRAADSVLMPLLISDLPVFLRWRGDLPFGEPELEGLVGLADRLIVDGAEWDDPGGGYVKLVPYFDRAAVSDIAWARTQPWRTALADRWPAIGEIGSLAVRGPRADSLLLAGWLRSRLGRDVDLAQEGAGVVDRVAVDGEDVAIPRHEPPSAADVLSDQLEIYSRDRVYEEAVAATS